MATVCQLYLTEYDYDTRMGILTAFFDTSVDISAGGYYTGLEAIVSCSTSARAIKELGLEYEKPF